MSGRRDRACWRKQPGQRFRRPGFAKEVRGVGAWGGSDRLSGEVGSRS